MFIARCASYALALCCGVSFAAESPLEILDLPQDAASRLAAQVVVPPADRPNQQTAGILPAWSLRPYETRYAGADPKALAVGHITGQQRPDVVIATGAYFDPDTDYHLLLFRPEGTTGFLTPLLYPYDQYASVPSLAVLDLDGNNGADVVVGSEEGLTVFQATADGTLVASDQHPPGVSIALAVTDLDQDGWQDLAAVTWETGGMIHHNLHNGSFQSTPWSATVTGYTKIGQGDIDGDGLVDVVVSSGQGTEYIRLYRNTGAGTLAQTQLLPTTCPERPWVSAAGVGIGDVDGDGRADIIATGGDNPPSSCVMIFHADGTGGFDDAIYLASDDLPETLRVSDIDGDRRDDVIVVHGSGMALGVYLQQENGSLAPERLFPLPYATHYSAHAFEIVDLDLDGCADVALVDYNNGLVTLRGINCGIVFTSGFEQATSANAWEE